MQGRPAFECASEELVVVEDVEDDARADFYGHLQASARSASSTKTFRLTSTPSFILLAQTHVTGGGTWLLYRAMLRDARPEARRDRKPPTPPPGFPPRSVPDFASTNDRGSVEPPLSCSLSGIWLALRPLGCIHKPDSCMTPRQNYCRARSAQPTEERCTEGGCQPPTAPRQPVPQPTPRCTWSRLDGIIVALCSLTPSGKSRRRSLARGDVDPKLADFRAHCDGERAVALLS